MATQIWQDVDGSDFLAGSNWSPGSVGAGDTLLVLKGSKNITGADKSATAFVEIIFGEEFTGTIGSAGSFLILDVDTISFANQAATFVSVQNGGVGADTEVVVHGTESTVTPTTNGLHLATNHASDQIEPLEVHSGKVTIEDSSNVDNVFANGGTTYLGASISGMTNVRCLAGATIENESNPSGTVYVQGGSYTHKAAVAGSGFIVDLSAGLCTWDGAASDITRIDGWGGTFNLANASYNFTITDITIWDAVVDLTGGIHTPTITNAVKQRGSGTLKLDPRADLTVTYA